MQSALAQAWVQPKGEGYASFGYQNWYAKHHLFGDGRKYDVGHMFTQVVGMGLAYGLTDRLTLTADMPLIFSKYQPVPGDTGAGPHGLRPHTIDDGGWRPTVTDLRIEARYNAVMRPLAITPFIATVIPTHRYETFGHAAPGRDLRELQIGTSIGRQLDPVLPRAFFDLRYGYSFAQEVAGINVDRNNVDLQVGYFLSLRLSVRAFGGWQRTREGIELPIGPSNPLFILHDRLQRTHLMRTGGAFSFSAGRTWDLYGFVAGNLSGKNTHSPLVVGIGITRTFGGRQDAESLTGSMSRSETEQRMLASNPMERLGLGAGASPRAAR